VNKNELIEAVSSKTDLKKSEASKLVDAVFESIATALKDGDDVRLIGFGSFSIASRDALGRRKPRTGETIWFTVPKSVAPQPQQINVSAEGRQLPASSTLNDDVLLEEAAEEFRNAAERLLAVADQTLVEVRKGREETRVTLDRLEAHLASYGQG
jgi:DNA-binding protein HU-beta